jgi:hypothetical protein
VRGVVRAFVIGGSFRVGGCGRVALKMDGASGWGLEIRRASGFDQLLRNFFDLRFADARFHRQIAEVKPAAKIPLALTDVIPAA